MKKILVLFLVAVMAISMISCQSKDEVVYVYNWGDYIDENIIDMFEEETGIKVVYEMFETNELMYTKLKNGGNQYDVCVPSDYMITKMINEDMIQKIDFSKIDQYENIGSEYKGQAFDPNDEYSVPYFFGTNGILYNTDMVTDPVDSWNILWDEKYAGQILMNNSQRDSIMVALKLLGYSMNTTDENELEEAKQLLLDQHELVLAYVVDNGKDMMLNEEAAFLVTWNGDAITLMGEKDNLAYAIPKEGSNLWIDSMVIPKDAGNVENAHKFINFMLRPDIALLNTDYVGYSTPNTKAFEMLDDEMKNNPAAYPNLNELENMEVFIDLGDAINIYNDIWLEITSQ
ncbi:ABC transporter substrate-binding protein [Acidaminobacter sp. JC074]|uniref:ABC transporter substrate-binding protein n=1 Tax=Acidaminobacter sp. JC074 TaxID=2530199 RepID=UPI001F1085E0|nr:ABC transporter substrate-binding protein [Acidaminobacter sp. JC074]MCH4889796.1 ABC transporter substrate-binding protein [Acidaminobacter sp. JC074]